MTQNEFIQKFAEVVAVEPSLLTPECPMTDLAGWDSVAILSAMILIDSEVGLTIKPEVLGKAPTFGDILSAVSAHLAP